MAGTCSFMRDHPRMRGEHIPKYTFTISFMGSSPHARGALTKCSPVFPLVGIIPACAGSTTRWDFRPHRPGDHPRMRGEHDTVPGWHYRGSGSSPHARGAPITSTATAATVGIIPACAGSTRRQPNAGTPDGDHPRMRGEHLGYMIEALDAKGSSPHARGAQCLGAPRAEARRIIPACAGSTARMPNRCCRLGDHPRMRGEHATGRSAANLTTGSSPHARGAQGATLAEIKRAGIIPACAGSTTSASTTGSTGWDHPRMRGEHLPPITHQSHLAGSSPHARGAHSRNFEILPASGIIPACAGSTMIAQIKSLSL